MGKIKTKSLYDGDFSDYNMRNCCAVSYHNPCVKPFAAGDIEKTVFDDKLP